MVRITFIRQRSNKDKLHWRFQDSTKRLRCRPSHQYFTIYLRITLTLMFPKFIQVGLYSGMGGVYTGGGAYIRDINWVTYLGGVYSGRLVYGGRINGILR